MSDLIRQSVSWPSVHGTRSYSRVTQLGRGEGEGEGKETKAAGQGEAKDEKSGASTTGTRRGGLIDLSV